MKSDSELQSKISKIVEAAQFQAVAVALHDYESGEDFSIEGDRWFHAASTFKAAILLALLKAVEANHIRLTDHLQVRNRFLSVKTGEPYRIKGDRDGDSSVHSEIGRSLPLRELAKVMITRSSNIATNLLIDFLGLKRIHEALEECGVEGIQVRRGVEDIPAHEDGINNEATAAGLIRVFRCFIDQGRLREKEREIGLEILHAQEFNRMIPGRLPKGVRVAHKTGEISTHCHDAGIVFPPDRKPYVLAILTETSDETENRSKAVAEISATIYAHTVGSEKSKGDKE